MPKTLRWLYVVNLALAAAHQVLAAHWEEWGLLGIPVGLDLFTILTFGIFLVLLHGLVQLARGRRAGLWYSGVLAGGGMVTTACHAWFLGQGDSAFTGIVALALLSATGAVSIAQAWVTVQVARSWPGDPDLPEPDFV
jgi:hypothetical protein